MKTLTLLFVLSISLFAQDINYLQVHNVKSYDVLNIREKADHTSKKLSGIPHSEKCVISYGCGKDISLEAMGNMHEQEIKDFLAQSKEKWCYIKHNKTVGWVNSKFLKPSTASCK